MSDVMKARMIEADFEKDTLTFEATTPYYARSGWFYIVPNVLWEEIQERLNAVTAEVTSPAGVPSGPAVAAPEDGGIDARWYITRESACKYPNCGCVEQCKSTASHDAA
jgi:hypothetical protein